MAGFASGGGVNGAKRKALRLLTWEKSFLNCDFLVRGLAQTQNAFKATVSLLSGVEIINSRENTLVFMLIVAANKLWKQLRRGAPSTFSMQSQTKRPRVVDFFFLILRPSRPRGAVAT